MLHLPLSDRLDFGKTFIPVHSLAHEHIYPAVENALSGLGILLEVELGFDEAVAAYDEDEGYAGSGGHQRWEVRIESRACRQEMNGQEMNGQEMNGQEMNGTKDEEEGDEEGDEVTGINARGDGDVGGSTSFSASLNRRWPRSIRIIVLLSTAIRSIASSGSRDSSTTSQPSQSTEGIYSKHPALKPES
jgi:hypothetical protein